MIGVVGAYGSVGSAACARLAASGHRLRVGGRDGDRSTRLAERIGAEPCAVDLYDDDSTAAFAANCQVLLNCAGPSAWVGDRVARAAVAAGADYVDAAGDDDLYDAISALDRPTPWRAVLSAGMMPGLTGLVPRLLASQVGVPLRLRSWVGGRDRFSLGAAIDYLTPARGAGEALAGWRHGAAVPQAERLQHTVLVPFFPGPVAVIPFLSSEGTALAVEFGLIEGSWLSVFDGDHLWRALTLPTSTDITAQAAEIVRASALDLFSSNPYQLVVVELAGSVRTRTAVVRAAGASLLTGVIAAMATEAVLDGGTPFGVSHAAQALDPERVWRQCAAYPAVGSAQIIDGVAADLGLIEEGVL